MKKYIRLNDSIFDTTNKYFAGSYVAFEIQHENPYVHKEIELEGDNIEDLLKVGDLITVANIEDDSKITSTIDSEFELKFVKKSIKLNSFVLYAVYLPDYNKRGYHLVWDNARNN